MAVEQRAVLRLEGPLGFGTREQLLRKDYRPWELAQAVTTLWWLAVEWINRQCTRVSPDAFKFVVTNRRYYV